MPELRDIGHVVLDVHSRLRSSQVVIRLWNPGHNRLDEGIAPLGPFSGLVLGATHKAPEPQTCLLGECSATVRPPLPSSSPLINRGLIVPCVVVGEVARCTVQRDHEEHPHLRGPAGHEEVNQVVDRLRLDGWVEGCQASYHRRVDVEHYQAGTKSRGQIRHPVDWPQERPRGIKAGTACHLLPLHLTVPRPATPLDITTDHPAPLLLFIVSCHVIRLHCGCGKNLLLEHPNTAKLVARSVQQLNILPSAVVDNRSGGNISDVLFMRAATCPTQIHLPCAPSCVDPLTRATGLTGTKGDHNSECLEICNGDVHVCDLIPIAPWRCAAPRCIHVLATEHRT